MRELTKREASNIAANMERRSECNWAEVRPHKDGHKVVYEVSIGILWGATFRGEVTTRV